MLVVSAAGGMVQQRTALREYPADLVVPSERSFKLDQIEALRRPPELIVFGGSRSTRFRGTYIEKKTGLRAFNCAMTNGRAEDAYAILRYLYQRWPNLKLRVVWGLQVSVFYTRDLDPGLLQDPRLSWWLPDALLRQQRPKLPKSRADFPVDRLARRRYKADGTLVWNAYDARRQAGLTLERALDIYIRGAVKKAEANEGLAAGPSRTKRYFSQTLALLNEHGCRPLLICMPVHPRVLRELRRHGWDDNHARFVSYLDSLRGQHDFGVLDLSEIRTFHGDPTAFYDGVHITSRNADRIVDLVAEAAQDELHPGRAADTGR